MNSLVSIITANYNGERFLAETVRSVQAQTYPHWEMIIVDDASKDASAEVIRSLQMQDSRIKLIQLATPSGGPAHPRNVALDNAQGQYVAFLDSDDLWHPQKLELQLDCLRRYNSEACAAASHRFVHSDELTPLLKPLDAATLPVRTITHAMLLRRHFTPHLLAERHLFATLRFPEGKEFAGVEDYCCWLLLHQHHISESIKILQPLGFYRQHHTSLSAKKWDMAKKNYRMYKQYKIAGKKLGWRVTWFFVVYAVRSVTNRFATMFNIPSWNSIDY